MRLSPSTMTLRPGQTRRVSATIRLPRGAGSGQHVGGLAIENEQVQTHGRGTHVLIDVHYRRVIAAVLVAPGAQRLAARARDVTLDVAPVGSVATLALRNSGTVLLNGTGTLQVQRRGALTVTAPFEVDTMLPAATIHVPVALPTLRLQPGVYRVRLRLRATTGAVLLTWQRQVVVARAAVAAPPRAVTVPSIHELGQPGQGPLALWALAGVVILLLGIGLGVVVGRRAGQSRG